MANFQGHTPKKNNKQWHKATEQAEKPRMSLKTVRSDGEESDDSIRKKKRSEYSELETFKTEMREMLSSMFSTFSNKQNDRMKTIEKQLLEVKGHTSAIADMDKSLSHMSSQLTDMQKKIDRLEEDKKETKTQISALEDRIDVMDRLARKTCVEIRGVPKFQKEKKDDLFSMIENLLTALKIEYSPSDLRDVYRIPNRNNASVSTIVAEFSSTLLKSTVLSKSKSTNQNKDSERLNTRLLGLEGNPSPLYISEHLTPKARRLHYLAREFKKTHDYSFCWPSNGTIFLRKREGMPHIVIENEAQLEAMNKSA